MVFVYKIKDEVLGEWLVKAESKEVAEKQFPELANMEMIAIVPDYVITALYYVPNMIVKV